MPSRKLKRVRRTLADGTVKTYEYDLTKPRKARAAPKTLGTLIVRYKESRDFQKLGKNTKRSYLRAMDILEPLRHNLVADIRRGHIVEIRDALAATPAIANQVVAVASILMEFAIEREWRETNPAHRVKKFEGGEFRRWTEGDLAHALDVLPERFRRAVILALFTGQREGDCCAMRWSDYDGEGVYVAQEKTDAKLWVPCAAELKAELTAWKKGATAVTILTDLHGRPWNAGSFCTLFSREMRRHRALDGCVFHGLRKNAAAQLAEVGCTVKEIVAITGHKSVDMAMHYTREAEQRELAKAAILKLDAARGKQTGETG